MAMARCSADFRMFTTWCNTSASPVGRPICWREQNFFGGTLIIAGLLTRFVAAAMLIDMFVAIWKIHWHNGLKGPGGYEFPLCIGVIAFALIFFGAGPIALDSIRKGGGGGRTKSKPLGRAA